jgi:CBS domain-containing protein
MKVKQIMTRQVVTAGPRDSIQAISRLMAEADTGAIPIQIPTTGALVGVITDRDIVVRAVAPGLAVTVEAAEIMSHGIETCHEDDDIADAAEKMAQRNVRRLVVFDRDDQLSGILSLGDITRHTDTIVSPATVQGG